MSTGGVRVTAALRHTGAARLLVHRLKYRALPGVADLLAEVITPGVPEGAVALVPVPRAVVRRWRHGVDPALAIARALSQRTGIPVVEALRPGLWWPHHAGRGGRPRSPVRLAALGRARQGWVLVDDVTTSGATLEAAAATLSGVRLAVVATAPGTIMGRADAAGAR